MQVRDVLPRDAIPSVDSPRFGTDYFGEDGDDVVAVEHDDRARAYPLRILSYHEVVNVAEEDLAVTWCPICGSAVVYEATVDGRALTFGVSGKLADDGLVLYDRETESEWHQPTGECLDGPFAGERLRALPASVLPYGRFREAYPDGEVLQPERGRGEPGGPAAAYDMDPYEAYFDREAFGLHGMRGMGEPRSWDREDLGPKAVVLGLELGGEAVAYPRERVAEAGGLVTDTVGGRRITVVLADGELHAFATPEVDLSLADGSLRGDGTTWDPATGESADGRRLDRLPGRRLFAFAWQDAHGRGTFYTSQTD